jgi:hypothetical protein
MVDLTTPSKVVQLLFVVAASLSKLTKARQMMLDHHFLT